MKQILINIYVLIFIYILISINLFGQVKTDFNNASVISNQGRFMKDYAIKVDFEIPAKDINMLLDEG